MEAGRSVVLPGGGRILVYDAVYDPDSSHHVADALRAEYEGVLRRGRVRVWGKEHATPRRIAAVGVPYFFSGCEHPAVPFGPVLAGILDSLRTLLAWPAANSVLLNDYADGRDCIGAHSDDETCLLDGRVATLSLGAARDMVWRYKASGERCTLLLEPGSLLVFDAAVNTAYTHEIPRRARCGPRLSVTVRALRG